MLAIRPWRVSGKPPSSPGGPHHASPHRHSHSSNPVSHPSPPRADVSTNFGWTGPTTGALRAALLLNPMTPLIAAFRASIVGGPIPWGPLAGSVAGAAAMFLIGCLYFRRAEDRFADII